MYIFLFSLHKYSKENCKVSKLETIRHHHILKCNTYLNSSDSWIGKSYKNLGDIDKKGITKRIIDTTCPFHF